KPKKHTAAAAHDGKASDGKAHDGKATRGTASDGRASHGTAAPSTGSDGASATATSLVNTATNGRHTRRRDDHDDSHERSPQVRAALRQLFELGHERGYVTEDDIDQVFEEDLEPPDNAEIELIHRSLLDARIEIVEHADELAEVQDDIQTEERLDRVE